MDRHNLTEVDLVGRTAVCRVCGPTEIYVPPKNGRLKRLCVARWKSLKESIRDHKRLDASKGHTYVNHMIVKFNPASMRGECRVCGPVSVKLVGKDARRRCVNAWGKTKDSRGHRLTRGEAAAFVLSVGRCQNPGCNKKLVGPGPGSDGGQVDHDHATDAVRGVLCGDCNRALGHAKDSVKVLAGLISYLEAPPGYKVC